MEVPAIAADVYRYYGPQPFKIAGLPLWFQSMNAASPIIGAALLHLLGGKRGWHPALAVAVVPSAHVVSNAVAGWPMWTALNSTDSLAITYPLALVTIGLASLTVYFVGLGVSADGVGSGLVELDEVPGRVGDERLAARPDRLRVADLHAPSP